MGEIDAAVFGVRMVPRNPDRNRSQNRHERQHIEIPPSPDPSSLSAPKPQGHRSVRLQKICIRKREKDTHRHEPDVRLSFIEHSIHRADRRHYRIDVA